MLRETANVPFWLNGSWPPSRSSLAFLCFPNLPTTLWCNREAGTGNPPPPPQTGAFAPSRPEYDTSSRAREQVHDGGTTYRARVRD